jgi:hypothetical protein
MDTRVKRAQGVERGARKRKLASNGNLYGAQAYTVYGSGGFPLDMLRYDRSWPQTSGADVPNLFGGHDAPMRQVVLETFDPNAPNADRWRSFGWHVIDIEGVSVR